MKNQLADDTAQPALQRDPDEWKAGDEPMGALHDLGHILQIAELVRARKYLGGAGPLRKHLAVETVTTGRRT